MRHASKIIQNLDEQIVLLLNQMSWVGILGTNLDYLARIGPPAIMLEGFPRNECDGTRFSTVRSTAKKTKEYNQTVKR